METFRDIIDRFASAEALAAEIKEKGVTVRAWRMRNSIPPRYWPAVADAAQRTGKPDVTVEALCHIAIAKSQERQAS